MNLHRLVEWANALLQHSSRGNAATGSMLAKLRASLDQLPECKAFITLFLRDALPLLACQKILKKSGLNRKTYGLCKKLIANLPVTSPIKNGFTEWAEKQLSIAGTLKLDGTGMPISTDALESLFGVGKRFGTGQIKDADRIASRLPAFCGTLDHRDAENVVAITVAQQQSVRGGGNSLIKQRRDILSNPGKLETLAVTTDHKNFQLIRGATCVT